MCEFIRNFCDQISCCCASKLKNLAVNDEEEGVEHVEIQKMKKQDYFPDLLEQVQIVVKPSSAVAARLSEFKKQDEADAKYKIDHDKIQLPNFGYLLRFCSLFIVVTSQQFTSKEWYTKPATRSYDPDVLKPSFPFLK
ncbi:unnamed protein product [Orchesella dallaii]|uniref:Uncharacterized protein n=1 Tax=Orchesella dallaii TaxID=48710 RepID=A0ABP1QSF5_9HEXA